MSLEPDQPEPARSAVRVLVYGMQSSGASLFTYYLAQMPDSLAVLDVWAQYVTPPLATNSSVITKVTVSADVDLGDHLASFRPTHTVLFVRDPVTNYPSLDGKPYRDIGGTLEEKLTILDQVYRRRESLFDATVYLEEFLSDPSAVGRQLEGLGLTLPGDALEFPRSVDSVRRFAIEQSAWCREFHGLKWDCGNIHADRLTRLDPVDQEPPPPEIVDRIAARCPAVLGVYRDKDREQRGEE